MSRAGRDAMTRVRSLLFTPGNDERKLRSALVSDADVVIADLEDAVPEDQKDAARATIARAFGAPPSDHLRCVRIGALGTPAAEKDLRLVESLELDLVVVPKATPEAARALPGSVPTIALVETPAGLRAAHEVAMAPSIVALMLGSADLSVALGLEARNDGQELLHARSRLVLDSAAAGLVRPFDGPRLDFHDEGALRTEVALVRALGFGGKACIHPAQIAALNEGFTPSAKQVEWAKRTVAALEVAEREGRGAVAVDGTMIDQPVVAHARGILARA